MTGWMVPGAPTDSAGLNPQQQKQFSSWWLDEQYGGDLNNVPGLTQNENGYWQGVPGQKYDINPETGQKGTFQFLSGSGAPGWLDVTPKNVVGYTYGHSNEEGIRPGEGTTELVRNSHGYWVPNSYFTNGDRHVFTHNPNTGEEGDWIWLGQMGWTNIRPVPQPEPADGTYTFGAGGQIAGPYNSARDNPNGDRFTTNTTTTPAPPADPTIDSTPPVVPRTGMLNPDQNSWLQVLNRQGADIDSWDSYLGMFTNQSRGEMPDWSSLDSNQVQEQFSRLAGDGLFTGLSQADVYADLLKRLGYSA